MNARRKIRITNTITAMVVIICILQVMRWSYQDAIAEQNNYCEMVRQHVWPDYKHDYARVCK